MLFHLPSSALPTGHRSGSSLRGRVRVRTTDRVVHRQQVSVLALVLNVARLGPLLNANLPVKNGRKGA